MSSYLEEELANISRMKMELEQKQSEIQKQIELELEKNKILELNGTIEKLQVQINELSKEIAGDIMPDNLEVLIFSKSLKLRKIIDNFHYTQRENLSETELEEMKKRVENEQIKIRNEIEKLRIKQNDRKNKSVLSNKSVLISLDEFKKNLIDMDLDTKKKFCRNSQTDFVEIKTEVKIYDDLIPIFRTLIGIISKQQKEINQLKNVSN